MILSTLENGNVVRTKLENIKFDLTADVLIFGAGSAGVYAADSAARMGARVILCEISNNIGGMSVTGNVTGYYYGMPGGSYEEDDEVSGADTVFLTNMAHWEQRQIRSTERLMKSGAKVLCRHSATGLLFEEERIVGARVFDGKRTLFIGADITVDATSDGHLVRMTDVKKTYGRPSDGAFVPFTVRAQYVEDGKMCSSNADSGIMNHYDASDFTNGTILAHANISSLVKEGEFVNLALQTGIREGLSFEGEDSVRYEDLLLGNEPKKVLFWAYSDLDRHGGGSAIEEELFQNWWVVCNLSTVMITIPVPMGSIVPKGIRGLVTAGRCLSCDTYSQTAVRMNKDMYRMGECVGIAAALAAKDGVDFLNINYDEYLKETAKYNCFDGNLAKGYSFDNSYRRYLAKMESLNRIPDPKYAGLSPNDAIREPVVFAFESNRHLLKTDAPGVAIWSAFVHPDREAMREKLYRMLSEATEDQYRYNCAIALGLLEDVRALSTLREIVERRDPFFFKENRRSNQFRSVIATCLVGRLGGIEDMPLLYEILSENECEREMYHTLKPNYLYGGSGNRNVVYFAMLSHASMSLYKIYRRCGLDLGELHARLLQAFTSERIMKTLVKTGVGSPAYEATKEFTDYVLALTEKK